ncbi:hypothetical protein PKF05_07095 [Fusobacterium simiae]|uniref:hypothetical protein n=1 Tax=Fusobacterium TaxID=848 RepID=UPI00042423E7|nr:MULTISPECIES: hypothetical protein [Fusobacterium]MDC7955587.1 hypothetical protein [Fusobacterium simiae]
MAVKINLEKYGVRKKGFLGFSYTTYFFNAFVPIFRLDLKGFIILLAIWLASKGFINIIGYLPIDWGNNPIYINLLKSLLNMKLRNIMTYIILTAIILFVISSLIWILIGIWYNKYYTKRLLDEGYSPVENDNYSLALLKEYGYLEYTEDEKNNDEKMELYKNIVIIVKKDERIKLYVFLAYFIFIIIIFTFIAYTFIYVITNYLNDITLIEFLQKIEN